VYEILSDVIVLPVSFVKNAPKTGSKLPLRNVPRARSVDPSAP